MKQKLSKILVIPIMFLLIGCHDDLSNVQELTKEELEYNFETMNNDKNSSIKYNGSVISEIDGYFTDTTITDEKSAYRLIKSMEKLFGITDITKQIRMNLNNSSTEIYAFEFVQCINGIPVENHFIKVIASKEDGRPHYIFSNYDMTLNVETSEYILESQAKATAIDYIEKKLGEEYEATECELSIRGRSLYYRILAEEKNRKNGYEVYVDAIENRAVS